MDALLALYNIRTVRFWDSSGVERQYSFSSKMLANNIFIEHYTIDPSDMEDEEEGDEVEGIEEDYESPEYGSLLSVIMEHKGKHYDFVMFYNSVEIGAPVMLLQTIIFLVKLIEETKPAQLIEYLTSIATDPLIPHSIHDKEFRDSANNLIKLKLQTIHTLIQEDNAGRN